MKARNLTALAVVATGAVALTAPAAFAQAPDVSGLGGDLKELNSVSKAAKKQARDARKKSKFETRTDNDIKRLGNNVHDLRKRIDETNSTISNIVTGLTPVLTQLGAAASSYANFEYGVVQLTRAGTAIPLGFLATPRIDPTVEQATVTGQFSPGGTGQIGALVGIRSASPTANDKTSTPYCRITVSQDQAGGGYKFVTSSPNPDLPAPNPAFWAVERGPLAPESEAEQATVPFALNSEDKTTELLSAAKSTNQVGNLGPSESFSSTSAAAGATGLVNVTLSCVSVPKT